ncbi:MAG: endonuclease domain-containing protein, partial [bacterium]|nr:endonuclease domain-containing protein [bacterium]
MTTHKTSISRNLRKNTTRAEQRLWSRLRSRQLLGLKFRRQHPIGNYVVDFVCLEKNVVIEVDGGQHLDDVRDKERDQWLSNEGYGILRYWNDQVLK